MYFGVLTAITGGSLRGWDLLDQIVDAVESQPHVLGASVAGGDEPSAFVTVEASNTEEAKKRAATAVSSGLADAGEVRRTAVAGDTYDADGRLTS